MGGDHRSERIEGHKDTILAILEAKSDIAIEELREALGEKGVVVGYGTSPGMGDYARLSADFSDSGYGP
jgi:hypothetical protein